jgi:hypothetical protein
LGTIFQIKAAEKSRGNVSNIKDMTRIIMYGEIERLIAHYEALIEEANLLEKDNPQAYLEKLKTASVIRAQIEELKIAKNN